MHGRTRQQFYKGSVDWRAVAAVNDQLHIALAGENQVWSYDLGKTALALRAGSGALAVKDGHGGTAAFAQPVGLAAVQQTVYVCDGVGSAIRSLQLRDHAVQTLVGQGAWAFGHADGPRNIAQLQEPQAIALDPDAQVRRLAMRAAAISGAGMASVVAEARERFARGDRIQWVMAEPILGPEFRTERTHGFA